MRTAQQLYEGVDIPGEGPVGLITYMRTDSTNISGEALSALRSYIGARFGEKYLPEKPNFFSSSNKDAQEAHEAIRPTNVELTPARVARALNADQLRLYTLIWERAVACQMTPAQWDSTAITIKGGADPARPCSFRATGRVLVFDGFYKVAGVPQSADEQTLPRVSEKQALAPVHAEAQQKFTSPPARYTEASLIKILEQEGIGRPSTYASIISVIQERNYVEKLEGRFFATDLGEVVTDKLIEAFPEILDVGYTREMETQLDKVEDDHLDWVEMLRKFYGPFKKQLALAETGLVHAKAEQTPAPPEYTCPLCESEGRGKSALVYRFGKNGRFLSCSRFNEGVCKYASPVDRDGKPRPAAATVDVACHKCGAAMTKRVGRFGPFLGCSMFADKSKPCDGLLNLDKKGRVEAPSLKPLLTQLPCSICEAALYLRSGVRGPWLSCSRFPKCRGRGKWAELPEAQREVLELALAKHEAENPIPIIRTMSGKALTDAKGKPLADARPVGGEAEENMSLEAIADEVGV
jgi:DNA topoisomerase-1